MHTFNLDFSRQRVDRAEIFSRAMLFGRLEPVILKEIPPPQCLENSMDFLKKRKMQVSRSPAVLNNSNQALRLLSKTGLLSNK